MKTWNPNVDRLTTSSPKQPPLFPATETPEPAAPKRHYGMETISRTPKPYTCPACKLTVLRALVDGMAETLVDPRALTPAAAQAASLLGRALYRLDQPEGWSPQNLWSYHPNDLLAGEHVVAEHQCDTPPLPGDWLPVRPPPRAQANHHPPF